MKLIKALAMGLMFLTHSSWGFDYPTAIPDAWISPNIASPEDPSDWSVEIVNKYYVDSDTQICSHSVDYGTPTAPRCWLPTTLAAGSYVKVAAGLYDYSSLIRIKSEGTASNPVWVIAEEGNQFDLSVLLYGTYLYADGFKLRDESGIDIRPYNNVKTNNILVRNMNIEGTGLVKGVTGISVNGLNGYTTENVIAYNNHIAYLGRYLPTTTTEDDNHAMQTGSYLNNVWFLYNESHHTSGDGVQFSHGGVEAHHFYYGGNISHDERENCVDVKQANDVIVSDNICYNLEFTNSSSGEGMVVHYDPERVWFINNDISNVISGIVSTGVSDFHVIGNNIHNMKEWSGEFHDDMSTYQTGAGIQLTGVRGTTVHNNTITNAVNGIMMEAIEDWPVVMSGNIVTDLHEGAYTGNGPYSLIFKGSGATASGTLNGAVFENNLFFNPAKAFIIDTMYETEPTLSAVGVCDDCIVQDPLYNDYPSDLTLGSSSPAVDGSVVPAVYSYFESLYGTSIVLSRDIQGVSKSSLPDIGAFESNGAQLYVVPKGNNLAIPDEPLPDAQVNLLEGVVSLDLDSYSGWYIPKMLAKGESGALSFGEISYSSAAYQINYSKFLTNKSGTSYSTGYSYVIGNTNSEITGSVTGTASADVYLMSNNYSGNTLTYTFTVNGEVDNFSNAGGFQQNKVTIDLTGTTSYSYKVVSGDVKSAIGISAIIEQ